MRRHAFLQTVDAAVTGFSYPALAATASNPQVKRKQRPTPSALDLPFCIDHSDFVKPRNAWKECLGRRLY